MKLDCLKFSILNFLLLEDSRLPHASQPASQRPCIYKFNLKQLLDAVVAVVLVAFKLVVVQFATYIGT